MSTPTEIRWFADSPDTGDPACICSWCGKPITEEDGVPIRFFDVPDDHHDSSKEARFHAPDCYNQAAATLGMPVIIAESAPGGFEFEGEQRCRVCGCTDEDPCPEGCWWVAENLCSACASEEEGGNG